MSTPPPKRRVAHPVLLAVFSSFIFSLVLLVIPLPIYAVSWTFRGLIAPTRWHGDRL